MDSADEKLQRSDYLSWLSVDATQQSLGAPGLVTIGVLLSSLFYQCVCTITKNDIMLKIWVCQLDVSATWTDDRKNETIKNC